MQTKMIQELDQMKQQTQNRRGHISKMLGDTINSIYDKKLYDIGQNRPAAAHP